MPSNLAKHHPAVQGLGFRNKGVGFRVQASGFRIYLDLKVCRIIAFLAGFRGSGLLFYIVLGFR